MLFVKIGCLLKNRYKMSSYKSIAKSSGLIAFVQIAQMAFSLARNKVVSYVLGSTAFGLYSIYQTFIEMVSAFSILGLNNSTVKEVSRCAENKEYVGQIYYVANRLISVFSICIFVLIFLYADEIGRYIFNEDGHTDGICCVAVIMLFSVVAKEGYAVLNGTRRLRDLAISQIVSSALGSLGTIVAILYWGVASIPVALGIIYVVMSAVTFYYVRFRNSIHEIKVSKDEFFSISKKLVYLGFGVTIAGIISTVMTILSKSYLTENFDISTVGLYQASWTISNLYTGIVLSAMGIDFMPRVSKVADESVKVNELINQQALFGVVVSSIAISGILLFSKEILYLLYSSDFTVSCIIIRWQILGVFLRVLAFPFSYTILAKGKAMTYAIIQIIFWTGDYLLLILCSKIWGFDGLGINYLIAYCGYFSMAFFVTRKLCHFSFSSELLKVLFKLSLFIISAWIMSSCLEINLWYVEYPINICLLALHVIFVHNYLVHKMDLNLWQTLKNRLRR